MTKVILDLNDPINIFRNKFNQLSNTFGDLDQLSSGDSDIVTAFNNTDSNVTAFGVRLDTLESPLDSSRVVDIINNDVFPITDSNDIADQLIKTAKLDNLAVNTSKLGELAVTTAKIDDLAVTTAKLNSLAVTAAKIDDNTITSGKLNNAVSLIIYDSTGSAIKTLYGAGA
jgi:hypothetical protein